MHRDWHALSANLNADANPTQVAQLRTLLDELHTWEQPIPHAQSCDIAVATQRTLQDARTLAARLGLTLR